MELKSMKVKREAPDEANAVGMDEREYPWGLSLSLDEESLDNLGMTELPDVGDTMVVMARVKVESVGQHESADDEGKQRNLSLQITEMALESDKRDPAKTLYGD